MTKRVSRGFHRLGIVFAAMAMLVGVAATIFVGGDNAREALHDHQRMVCARDKLKDDPSLKSAADTVDIPAWKKAPLADTQDLQRLGCTTWPLWVSTRAALATSDDFNWVSAFLGWGMFFVLGITLAVSLAVYALVRAIGWVIGGFAAS